MKISIDSNDTPILENIYRDGNISQESEIIFFNQPNPMTLQYLSLQPISLTLASPVQADFQSILESEAKVKQKYVLHGSKVHKDSTSDMQYILNQINSSFELENIVLNRLFRTSYEVPPSAQHPSQQNGNFLVNTIKFVQPIAVQPVILILFLLRVAAELTMNILNFKFGNRNLISFSAAAQQINVRLQTAVQWPWQYLLLRQRDWRNTLATRALYISFHNSVWLVANDIIIGIVLGVFIIDNVPSISRVLESALKNYTVSSFESTITWLMGWPAGLKLNNSLDKFLGELFNMLFTGWSLLLGSFLPFLDLIVGVIGLSGIFGASMIFSVTSDLLSLVTFHIYLFYVVASKIYNWQLRLLLSLFHLFRGKKYNILMNRLDSTDYAMDQLLLGTILFTLLGFLFPTVTVYYLMFAGSRIILVWAQVGLELALTALNHFPLFGLMLRIKDSVRLPGGLKFTVCRVSCNDQERAFLQVENLPLPFHKIFESFYYLSRKLITYHLTFDYWKSLMIGRIVSPLSHLKVFPDVPETRPSLLDFWLFLKHSFATQ